MRFLSMNMFVLSLALAGPLSAAEVLDLKASIIGNTELPKVIYIVPWKRPSQGDFVLPLPTLVMPGAEPAVVDREVFLRQIHNASLLATAPLLLSPPPSPVPVK